jgi:hypothetical protein
METAISIERVRRVLREPRKLREHRKVQLKHPEQLVERNPESASRIQGNDRRESEEIPVRTVMPRISLRSGGQKTVTPSPRSFSFPESHVHLFNRVRIRVWLICLLTPLILASSCQRQPPQPAGKWVEVDKTNQVLRAYAGDKLVFESPVSTGKEGLETPNGTFAASEKSRMHHSDLYDNAPMPYSVQIGGNYFIHGFTSVPAHPASHGCIRLPMEQAKQFFDWVEPGTPVIVTGKWLGRLPEKGKQARSITGETAKNPP